YTRITRSAIESSAHRQLARSVADNSLVLLKNSAVAGTSAPLLPVSPATASHVVILGNLAESAPLGDYSGLPSVRISAMRGLADAVTAANPDATVLFDAASTSTHATGPAVLSDVTRAAVRAADLVVLFVGTDSANCGEDQDRATLAMPGNYASLIEQVT